MTADVVEAVAVLVDLTAWPDAGLMLGRCRDCGSHLSLPLGDAVEALHRRDPLAARTEVQP